MMYEKKVDDLEYKLTQFAYELFHDANIMPTYSFDTENLLRIAEGEQVGNFGVSEIIKSISKISNSLYVYKVDYVDSSLYSFFPYENTSGLKYNMFLLKILYSLQNKYSFLSGDISILMTKIPTINPLFTLVHGDFHYGNIVRINDELLLIDWEYFSTGDPQLEICYFLLHYAIHKEFNPKCLSELCKSIRCHKYSFNFDFDLMINFYIPFLSLLFYDCVNNKKISNSKFNGHKLLNYFKYFNR